MTDLDDAATEALRIATIAPLRSLEVAPDVEAAARRQHEWAAASVAARASGIAALHLRDLSAASTYLRSALDVAKRASSPQLVGEARMSLAAMLVVRGSPRRAIVEIDSAVADLNGAAAARAMTQRAAILQVLGADQEALADIRRALPILRQANDVQWETRALTNRSLLLITRRLFASAEADLLAARKLCTANGLGLFAGYVEQNLGCLMASKGEVVSALDCFERAEQAYGRESVQVGSLLADRAQLLLSVRLVDEARVAAESAVAVYRAQRRSVSIPDALLLLATVALVQGDTATAASVAGQALRGFRRMGRRDGIALARFASLQAHVASGSSQISPATARRCATELAAVGWTVPSLEARVLAGRLALAKGDRAAARRDLGTASRARRAGPAEVRARAWLAEAVLRRADGRRRSASVALSTGLRVVENYQSTLGATELRAHVSAHRGALASLGLRMALEDKNARTVLSWAERGRASALLLRAPTPPHDAILAGQLADLRQTMTEIDERRAMSTPVTSLQQRQVELEHAIADRSRRLPARPGSAHARAKSLGELAAGLDDAVLIEYVEMDGFLHAVTVADARVRLHALGPVSVVQDAMAHVPFALQRLARPDSPRASRAGALAALKRSREICDQLLLVPLAREIGERALVIVPTGVVQSLPWSILPSCYSRPVTVVPSAALWYTALTAPEGRSAGQVVVVAGPGLPGAHEEAVAVAALYPDAQRLVGAQASASSVCAAIDGAALVHVAAHGRLRSDNPLFSALLVADGPVTVYDLERVRQAPGHVVLAACETAQSHVLAGDEVLGLAVALLAQGTTSLIAPVFAVSDTATVDLMVEYHRQLIGGSPPAHALSAARYRTGEEGHPAWAAGAAFVCMGLGVRQRRAA